MSEYENQDSIPIHSRSRETPNPPMRSNSSFSSPMCCRHFFADKLKRPVTRIPHLLADPFFQIRIVVGNVLLLRKALFFCLLDNVLRNLDANLANIGNVR